MIRLFKFKNNFLSENAEGLVAEYGVIGYFDGLDMDVLRDEKEIQSSLSDPFRIYSNEQNFSEMCDYFNIIGLRLEDDTDFWKQEKGALIFISCVRLKKQSPNLDRIIQDIESRYNAICYLTFDSSDMVICLKVYSYAEGYDAIRYYRQAVEKYDPLNRVQKCFSVLAVLQKVLDDLPDSVQGIKADEKISCVLRGVVKDWKCMDEFLEELKEETGADLCEKYGILGSEDIAIMLKGIQNISLLKLYGENRLLTHANGMYQNVFYNIRTEISVKL